MVSKPGVTGTAILSHGEPQITATMTPQNSDTVALCFAALFTVPTRKDKPDFTAFFEQQLDKEAILYNHSADRCIGEWNQQICEFHYHNKVTVPCQEGLLGKGHRYTDYLQRQLSCTVLTRRLVKCMQTKVVMI